MEPTKQLTFKSTNTFFVSHENESMDHNDADMDKTEIDGSVEQELHLNRTATK